MWGGGGGEGQQKKASVCHSADEFACVLIYTTICYIANFVRTHAVSKKVLDLQNPSVPQLSHNNRIQNTKTIVHCVPVVSRAPYWPERNRGCRSVVQSATEAPQFPGCRIERRLSRGCEESVFVHDRMLKTESQNEINLQEPGKKS